MPNKLRRATLGPRKIIAAPKNSFLHETIDVKTSNLRKKLFSNDLREITLASSNLVVVLGVLLGGKMDEIFSQEGIKTNTLTMDWNDSILEGLARDYFQMSIYNKNSGDIYIRNHPECGIVKLADIQSSMGGKNFSIIARRGHDLEKKSLGSIREEICQYPIFVSINSDRYTSLLTAIGMSDIEFREQRKAKLINQCEPSLDVLMKIPKALLVCGQNIRVASRFNPENFTELLNYDTLEDHKTKKQLIDISKNAIFISKSFYEKIIDAEAFRRKINENIVGWGFSSESISPLVKKIAAHCLQTEVPGTSLNKIIETILFETYRIGEAPL